MGADSLYPSHGGPCDRSSGEMGGREEPSPHGALTANGGGKVSNTASQSCCDIRDGDLRMESSGADSRGGIDSFPK